MLITFSSSVAYGLVVTNSNTRQGLCSNWTVALSIIKLHSNIVELPALIKTFKNKINLRINDSFIYILKKPHIFNNKNSQILIKYVFAQFPVFVC